MAKEQDKDRVDTFIKRAKQFNLSFIAGITILFVASLITYEFFSMPVSPKLLLYVYILIGLSTLVSYGVSALVRKKMFPVSTQDPYWSYTAVRRYFWSYVLLCMPFGIAFLFFLFAGNLSALVLGYLASLCGLILFKPKKGDVL